jgi:hypothetical protein
VEFDVPEATSVVQGGNRDVDYACYTVKRKGGTSSLPLCFGAYAMNMEPEDDVFANSESFQQQAIVTADGQSLGLDSSGLLQDATAWRQFFVSGEGARYSKASEGDAGFFNKIIDTFCVILYPAH